MNSKLRKVLGWAFALVFFVLLLEGAAYLYCRSQGIYNRKELLAAYTGSTVSQADPFYVQQSEFHRELHPYFAFVQRQGSDVNRAGFFDPHPFPYRKQDASEFVIGIFGGSVASYFAKQGSEALGRALQAKIPALKSRKLVFLNFAMGAHKQPQAFLISSFYSDSFDAAVNIEGFNELCDQSGYPVFPPDYPQYSELLYLPGTKSMQLIEQMYLLKNRRDDWTARVSEKGGVYQTYAYYLFWRALTRSIDRSIADLRLEWRRSFPEFDPDVDEPPERTRERYSLEVMDTWAEFASKQSRTLRALGKKSFTFIQPNQYLKDSKPLSEDERRVALGQGEVFSALVTRRYPYLLGKAKELQSQGVLVEDLTKVFAKTQETVYIDDCCHVNPLGNRLLAEAIAESIAANWNK